MAVGTNYLTNILGRDADAMLALRELPAFHDCSPQLLELIFRYGKIVRLSQDEELTREGDYDQWVYFIIDGRLAVYLLDEWVDTISSSLVGERCILGENRRATLRALEEGVTALGVDMALLDALRDEQATVREPVSVYLELLAIITGEVVNRIVELELNLLDFSHKYTVHTRTERISEILHSLSQDAYREDRGANFAVYRHLLRNNPVALARCTASHGYRVDTRQLYADAVLDGDHALLYAVAEAVLKAREEEEQSAGAKEGVRAQYNFAAYASHIAGLVLGHERARLAVPAGAQAMGNAVRQRLRLNEHLRVDLGKLMMWLAEEHRFTAEDTIELLMLLLKESSDFTARINGQIKAMVHELTQTRFAKELESASTHKGMTVAEYYSNTSVEDLIPFFSKNILDVYLVQPYVERLRDSDGSEWRGGMETPPPRGDALISTLFE